MCSDIVAGADKETARMKGDRGILIVFIAVKNDGHPGPRDEAVQQNVPIVRRLLTDLKIEFRNLQIVECIQYDVQAGGEREAGIAHPFRHLNDS